ncbi:aspartyl-phosphate phosphatase Spo0E family protein [Bacillus timonensis]|nr:aspartyl-phosphate phosphatase Spo0E family protein [Bacillus timonensis]
MCSTKTNCLDLLLQQIDEKREEMIQIGMKTGYTSDKTVSCSQELDQLLNQYQRELYKREVGRKKVSYFKQVILYFFGAKYNLKPAQPTDYHRFINY